MRVKYNMLLMKGIAVACAMFLAMFAYLGAFMSVYPAAIEPYMETGGDLIEEFPFNYVKYERLMVVSSAVVAVVFSWLSCKLEKPWRLLFIGMGVGCMMMFGTMAVSMCSLRVLGPETMQMMVDNLLLPALPRFLLMLAMLLAIIWLVSNMIRRHLTERK